MGWPSPLPRHKGAIPMPLDFTLTPEQEDIKGLAHEFAEKEIRPVAPHYDEAEEFPWPVLKKAHDGGLTPLASLPQDYGGPRVAHLPQHSLTGAAPPGCSRTAC